MISCKRLIKITALPEWLDGIEFIDLDNDISYFVDNQYEFDYEDVLNINNITSIPLFILDNIVSKQSIQSIWKDIDEGKHFDDVEVPKEVLENNKRELLQLINRKDIAVKSFEFLRNKDGEARAVAFGIYKVSKEEITDKFIPEELIEARALGIKFAEDGPVIENVNDDLELPEDVKGKPITSIIIDYRDEDMDDLKAAYAVDPRFETFLHDELKKRRDQERRRRNKTYMYSYFLGEVELNASTFWTHIAKDVEFRKHGGRYN